MKLHVVLAVDRAGLVGEDGETHHGVFDVGFLRQAPGMQILCPASTYELSDMMNWAVLECNGPVAVRYPRGGNRCYADSAWNGSRTVYCHRDGKDVAIVVYGTLLENALKAAEMLEQAGISAAVIRLLAVAPLPTLELAEVLHQISSVIVLEETCSGSGICEALASALSVCMPDCSVRGIDLGDSYVPHGKPDTLYKHCGLDSDSIAAYVREVLKVES